jgi:uncharacterized protein (DUF362 family)
MSIDRRTFLTQVVVAGWAVLGSPLLSKCERVGAQQPIAHVAFVKTSDRAAGVSRAIDLLQVPRFHEKDVFIKPNFNSADTPPGSTHMGTLAALVRKLRGLGAGPLTLGDRSGMGSTREVMDAKGVFRLGHELDVKAIVFDELNPDDWHRARGAHWDRGFALPRPVLNAGAIVQTCCLKTHRYGGHFTLSLKNSVGLAAKFIPGDPYNFMHELHSSPSQRPMIAEINAAYKPELVVLDGVEAFVTGGPDTGKNVPAQVILAGADRVAIDAVGVALLRYYGTTPEVSRGSIFEQEQIARAVELKLGARGPEHIELVTGDRESAEYAKKVRAVLDGAVVHA